MSRRYPDDPSPWTLVARTYLFRRPPWLTLRQDHLRLPSGREIAEYWISEYPPWVNVVAVTRTDQVVLVRQYRPGLGEVHFELPAGVVDDTDASPEHAARRELLEETGYAGGRWSSLLTLSANPALQSNLTYCFLAEGVEPVAAPIPETTEDLRVRVVAPGDLLHLIDTGEIVQALHAAPLLRYLLRRRQPDQAGATAPRRRTMAMRKGVRQMVDEAKARIRTISLEEARARLGQDDAVFVDLRDVRELDRDGMIPGAFHCPRGMLEFWIDPDSPYHKTVFASGKEFIFYCNGAWRSALAADVAQQMGLQPVSEMAGGFTAWKNAGYPVVERASKSRS